MLHDEGGRRFYYTQLSRQDASSGIRAAGWRRLRRSGNPRGVNTRLLRAAQARVQFEGRRLRWSRRWRPPDAGVDADRNVCKWAAGTSFGEAKKPEMLSAWADALIQKYPASKLGGRSADDGLGTFYWVVAGATKAISYYQQRGPDHFPAGKYTFFSASGGPAWFADLDRQPYADDRTDPFLRKLSGCRQCSGRVVLARAETPSAAANPGHARRPITHFAA
jgi:hypothetical protein